MPGRVPLGRDCMKLPTLLGIGFMTLLLCPVGTGAPLTDNQNSCTGLVATAVPFTLVPVLVKGTISYVGNRGLDPPAPMFQCPANLFGFPSWWGSKAAACPVAVGAIAGAYCGPSIPAAGIATCMIKLGLNTVPTALTIGFDVGGDQKITLTGLELNVAAPLIPVGPIGQWTVANPYPVAARVIAYPTDSLPGGALPPGDSNMVTCV